MCEGFHFEPAMWICCVVFVQQLRISLGVLNSVPSTDLDQIKWPNVPELWAGRKWLHLKLSFSSSALEWAEILICTPFEHETLSYFTTAGITSVNSHLSYNRQIFTCHFLAGRPKICISRIFFSPHPWKVFSLRTSGWVGCLWIPLFVLCKAWG